MDRNSHLDLELLNGSDPFLPAGLLDDPAAALMAGGDNGLNDGFSDNRTNDDNDSIPIDNEDEKDDELDDEDDEINNRISNAVFAALKSAVPMIIDNVSRSVHGLRVRDRKVPVNG